MPRFLRGGAQEPGNFKMHISRVASAGRAAPSACSLTSVGDGKHYDDSCVLRAKSQSHLFLNGLGHRF